MRRLLFNLVFLSVAATPSFASNFLFSGTLPADDQVVLFNFTANAAELITFQTYSYAGGTDGSSTFAAGGFAPVGFIFDNIGDVFTLTNGTCGQVGQDPVTNNCDDLYYQNTFGPGTFTLALAVDDNRPVDTTLSDGFIDDGNPGFTCNEVPTTGSFCDLTTALGTSRTGDYAISINGADSVTIPEPGGLVLLFVGAVFATLARRCLSARSVVHSGSKK